MSEAVCPRCFGMKPTCPLCGGRGLVPRERRGIRRCPHCAGMRPCSCVHTLELPR